MNFPITVFTEDRTITCSEVQFDNLFSSYQLIHAAGGIVANSADEILMIFRREKWDFPKGKVEIGENYEQAAFREVGEETGIKWVEILDILPSTFHTYEMNGEKIIKETHWYRMAVSEKTNLVPQVEEDITLVKWIPKSKVATHLQNSYSSLQFLWKNILNVNI